MNKEFVMRGQTASGSTEVLNFTGHKPGYAYRLVEFKLFASTSIGSTNNEFVGTVTAGKTAVAPTQPDFNNEGLIASAFVSMHSSQVNTAYNDAVINDTFLITQNLILMVQDASGEGNPVNWQCRFVGEKMNTSQQAVANYKQFTIRDE